VGGSPDLSPVNSVSGRDRYGAYPPHERLHVVAPVPQYRVDVLQVHLEHVHALRLDDLGHLRHEGPVLLLVQDFGEPVTLK